MNKSLSVVFDLSFAAAPVLAWGKSGCYFSNKNKASQVENIEQFESSDSSDK